MNFLSMCQRLRSEAGLSGSGPASVLSQTGMQKKIVDWVRSADEDIQNLHSDWEFLVRDFDFATTAAQQAYTPDDAGVSDLNKWRSNDCEQISCRIEYADEQFLIMLSWRDFKRTYLNGVSRSITGRPQFFAIKPDKSMILYPIPDAEYNISGEYFRKAKSLTENTEEPLYPSEYHMAAVWRALVLYGAYDAANEKYTHGQNEYNRLIGAMEANQMPEIAWGEPLA